jgi:hypothetical protein
LWDVQGNIYEIHSEQTKKVSQGYVDFLFYQQVLAQQPKDKNKIYSLHEPDVYVIAKVLYYATINEVKQADLLAVAKEFCINRDLCINRDD